MVVLSVHLSPLLQCERHFLFMVAQVITRLYHRIAFLSSFPCMIWELVLKSSESMWQFIPFIPIFLIHQCFSQFPFISSELHTILIFRDYFPIPLIVRFSTKTKRKWKEERGKKSPLRLICSESGYRNRDSN